VGGDVLDVLLAQGVGDAAHGGVLALTTLVGVEGRLDVGGALAGDLGHLVHLGEAGLVADDVVAPQAHGDLGFERRGLAGAAGLGARQQRTGPPEPMRQAGRFGVPKPVAQATARAKSVVSSLFILRAQSTSSFFKINRRL
jgi:hypothetical protein